MGRTMHKIEVSIVYASKDQQRLKELSLKRGASVADLITESNFLLDIDDLVGKAVESLSLGIYAQKTSIDALFEDGDRVEIYRELSADPKEVRRQLALIGKTIGKEK